MKARGERATPAMVEKEIMGLERAAAALASPSRRSSARAARAFWHACDLRDGAAVGAGLRERPRAQRPRVDVLLHGAGLEISRFLKDKEPREFDLVFDVKADGWFNVLKGLGDTPIGATVAFSSIAGRFGNGGQTDYSAANDLLCKTTSSFRTTRPETRGLVDRLDGLGRHRHGQPRLDPPDDGAGGHRHAAGGLGHPGDPARAHGRRAPGRDRDRGPARRPRGRSGTRRAGSTRGRGGRDAAPGRRGARLRRSTTASGSRPSSTRSSSRSSIDHRIEGTPVLPGVMGIESFAEAAALVLPGWHVLEVERDRLPRAVQVLPGRAARASP